MSISTTPRGSDIRLTNANFVEVIDSCVNESHQISLSWLNSHLKTLSATLSIHIHAVEEDVVGHISQRPLGTNDGIQSRSATCGTVTVKSVKVKSGSTTLSYISEIVMGPMSTSYPAEVGP